MKEDLIEQIRDKLNAEYEQYRESLMGMRVDDVINAAYELVIKKELTFALDSDFLGDLDTETLKRLHKCHNLLSWMYEEWLHSDAGIYEELQSCIKNSILCDRLPPSSTAYFAE